MAENYFGITDTGKVRDNNEDAFITEKVMNNKFILACVIDGVGGYAGGEVAADIARTSIIEYFRIPSGEVISMMKEAFIAANEKIFAEKQSVKKHDSMACVCTLAIADIENNQFYYAHVGDTRLYLFRDNSLVKVSKDHSFVGFLEDTGRLTEDAAMRHPKRNEINKALGFGAQLNSQDDYIETGQSPFLPGDTLMLCSDGLTDMVNKADITSILTSNTSLEQKGKDLIDAANKGGGKDNITVVLVSNNKERLKQEAMKPAEFVKKKEIPEQPEKSIDVDIPKVKPVEEIVLKEKKSGNKWLVPLLSFLSLFFLITSLLLWKQKRTNSDDKEVLVTQVLDTRNPQEIKLQAEINALAGDTLLLTDSLYTQPIIISDTLLIKKDSLYIKTKGKIVLKRDSAYLGPAISLASSCKSIVIDNLTFQDFNTGVSTHNNALILKNVLFNNCATGVQTMFTFQPSKYVSGRINNTFFKLDSLPKP
ncbi:MAG TPA: protein phosphatase 2C domain-containing protein [Sphingobacteriaceae bacterium]|nr:protein phosphatase 2C domain-containing protein [Sphingobacteriaceae bacterium]